MSYKRPRSRDILWDETSDYEFKDDHKGWLCNHCKMQFRNKNLVDVKRHFGKCILYNGKKPQAEKHNQTSSSQETFSTSESQESVDSQVKRIIFSLIYFSQALAIYFFFFFVCWWLFLFGSDTHSVVISD